jgi:hypothetical protein
MYVENINYVKSKIQSAFCARRKMTLHIAASIAEALNTEISNGIALVGEFYFLR